MITVFFPMIARFFKLKLTDDGADKFFSKVIIDALNHRQKTGEVREDFLQLMLEARLGQLKHEDETDLDDHERNAQLKEDGANKSKLVFTDDLIIAQCLLFFLAGFDTTESMVTFTLYELAINPEVQEKLYQEVKESVDENSGEFSYEVINKLEYLDMVVQESLRKYPPAVRTDRKCYRPFKLPETDFVIPKDMIVVLPIYPVHHDPEYWPKPEKFDPERFTKENSSKRHPCAFAPFGHGPRNCIGNRFALTEGKAAIAHLVLNFSFEPCEKTMIPLVFASSSPLKPTDNTPLRLKPRF
jgi:cytochrome P450 family 9